MFSVISLELLLNTVGLKGLFKKYIFHFYSVNLLQLP
jgi:hypothetical protein